MHEFISMVKFIYSEKATKFCEIFTLLLSYVVLVKSKVKISQNCVAFSEYMNFNMMSIIKPTFFFSFFRIIKLPKQIQTILRLQMDFGRTKRNQHRFAILKF